MMFFKCYKKLIHRIFLIFCINVHWHEGLILTSVILKFLGQKVVRNGPRAKSWEINAWNFLIFFIDKQQYKDLNLTVMSQIPKRFFFLKFYNKLMHWTSIIFGMRYEVKTASRLEIDWTYFDKILALGYVRQKGPEFIGLDLFCNQFLTLKVIQVFNCTLHENHFSYLYLWVQCHVLLFPFVLRQ